MHGIRSYNEVLWEYLKLLEKKEIYWRQRAKQFWLQEGDQNTRFFHRFASSRRKNNSIYRIKDERGEWKERPEDIQDVVTNFFSQLFQSSMANGRLSDREMVKTISETENNELVTEITDMEVKEAVFSMHPDKSPRPNGLNPVFFSSVLDYCRA